jgi:hypothetical protein
MVLLPLACAPPAPPAPPAEAPPGPAAPAPAGPDWRTWVEAAEDPVRLRGLEAPPLHLDLPQPCSDDAGCVVDRPSDWSAPAECCYEYACTVDAVALSRPHQEALRAWRRAHAFDCAAWLQTEGPCPQRRLQCGLSRELPPVACVEGQCRIQWPEPWPTIDPQAQTCLLDTECRPFRAASLHLREQCCGDACGTDWVAVHHTTEGQIRDWMAMTPAGACDAFACEPRIACQPHPPPVACVEGLCRLVPR